MKIQLDHLTLTEVRQSAGKEGREGKTYCTGIDGQGRDAGKITFSAPESAYERLADLQMVAVKFTATVRPSVFESVQPGRSFASKNLSLEVLAFDVMPVASSQPVNGAAPSK